MSNVLKKNRRYSDLYVYNRTFELIVKITKDLKDDLLRLENKTDRYLLDKIITGLYSSFNNLSENVLHADRITVPKFEFEINLRYEYQDKALGDCLKIQSDLNLVAAMFPELLGNLLHYANDFKKLERDIAEWKKYTEVLKNKIVGN